MLLHTSSGQRIGTRSILCKNLGPEIINRNRRHMMQPNQLDLYNEDLPYVSHQKKMVCCENNSIDAKLLIQIIFDGSKVDYHLKSVQTVGSPGATNCSLQVKAGFQTKNGHHLLVKLSETTQMLDTFRCPAEINTSDLGSSQKKRKPNCSSIANCCDFLWNCCWPFLFPLIKWLFVQIVVIRPKKKWRAFLNFPPNQSAGCIKL